MIDSRSQRHGAADGGPRVGGPKPGVGNLQSDPPEIVHAVVTQRLDVRDQRGRFEGGVSVGGRHSGF